MTTWWYSNITICIEILFLICGIIGIVITSPIINSVHFIINVFSILITIISFILLNISCYAKIKYNVAHNISFPIHSINIMN